MPAEIILIGGAAVLANYGFRDATYDIDAIIRANSSMKDVINKVGDELGLPYGWLNSDFIETKSYSPKLHQYSKYYKTFGYVLEVRTISGAYLVAMKLMSGRQYKNDISDVIGILREQKEQGKPLTIEMIREAAEHLYDSWERIPQEARTLVTEILQDEKLESLYEQYRESEKATRESLIDFNQKYPGVIIVENANDIIQNLKKRKEHSEG